MTCYQWIGAGMLLSFCAALLILAIRDIGWKSAFLFFSAWSSVSAFLLIGISLLTGELK